LRSPEPLRLVTIFTSDIFPLRKSDVNKKLFEFRCDFNNTRLIYQRGIYRTNFRRSGALHIGGHLYNESLDDGIEVFVPFGIRPNEIKDVKLVKDVPPMWKRD